MREVIISTEGSEPVTTAELQSYVGYPGTDSKIQTLLENLGKSARLRLEQYTGRNFVEKTMILAIDGVGVNVPLPFGPVNGVTSVEVYDVYGDLDSTLTEDDDFYLVGEFDRYIRLESWFHGAYLKITYTAGYNSDGYALPQALKDAILMQTKYDFDNRGAGDRQSLTTDVKNMVIPYRCSFL